MAAVSKLEITNIFEDQTTLKISIDGINPEVGINPNFKSIVQNFNNTQGGTLATKMRSKNGYNWIGIKAARLVTTDRTYIF